MVNVLPGVPGVTSQSRILMYADDTVLSYSTKHIEELEFHLNQDLDDWVKENGLSLNPTKTQFMIFGTPQKLATIPKVVTLRLESHALLQVKCYNTNTLGYT